MKIKAEFRHTRKVTHRTVHVALCIAGFLLAAALPAQAQEDAVNRCAALAGQRISARHIGLPTGGAEVLSATLVAPVAAGPTAAGEYCKVMVAIHAVSPVAPDIRFQLDLPTQWNKKALMFGGGGYDGTIRDPAGNVPGGLAGSPTPLARGYATFQSDSGHQAGGKYVGLFAVLDGTFGMNDEALNNFSGDFVKKTKDAALHLIAARYGQAPVKTYFAGGSSGGREALAAIQRWPDEFHGAIALYPAWNAASLNLQFGRISRAFAEPGAYPNVAKRKMLHRAVMAACDELDGVKDGLISNQAACKFDPASVRCPSGADAGDHCLSDSQINAMNAYGTPIRFAYTLGSKEPGYPGFNVYAGVDTAGAPPITSLFALNIEAPNDQATFDMPFMTQFWDMWVRYFVARDPAFKSMQLNPEAPGKFERRIAELAALQDVNDAQLARFVNNGGKLLMAHGTADPLVSNRATAEYYARLVDKMGAAKTREFVRYYEIPGFGHVLGADWTAAWDSLTALENWVERGVAPADQVVMDVNAATKGRTRPLCDYPSWPKYRGQGDVNSAASFVCS
jgi:hypothetical protein